MDTSVPKMDPVATLAPQDIEAVGDESGGNDEERPIIVLLDDDDEEDADAAAVKDVETVRTSHSSSSLHGTRDGAGATDDVVVLVVEEEKRDEESTTTTTVRRSPRKIAEAEKALQEESAAAAAAQSAPAAAVPKNIAEAREMYPSLFPNHRVFKTPSVNLMRTRPEDADPSIVVVNHSFGSLWCYKEGLERPPVVVTRTPPTPASAKKKGDAVAGNSSDVEGDDDIRVILDDGAESSDESEKVRLVVDDGSETESSYEEEDEEDEDDDEDEDSGSDEEYLGAGSKRRAPAGGKNHQNALSAKIPKLAKAFIDAENAFAPSISTAPVRCSIHVNRTMKCLTCRNFFMHNVKCPHGKFKKECNICGTVAAKLAGRYRTQPIAPRLPPNAGIRSKLPPSSAPKGAPQPAVSSKFRPASLPMGAPQPAMTSHVSAASLPKGAPQPGVPLYPSAFPPPGFSFPNLGFGSLDGLPFPSLLPSAPGLRPPPGLGPQQPPIGQKPQRQPPVGQNTLHQPPRKLPPNFNLMPYSSSIPLNLSIVPPLSEGAPNLAQALSYQINPQLGLPPYDLQSLFPPVYNLPTQQHTERK